MIFALQILLVNNYRPVNIINLFVINYLKVRNGNFLFSKMQKVLKICASLLNNKSKQLAVTHTIVKICVKIMICELRSIDE